MKTQSIPHIFPACGFCVCRQFPITLTYSMSGGIQWVVLLLRVAHLKQLHQVSNHSSVDGLHVVEQEES